MMKRTSLAAEVANLRAEYTGERSGEVRATLEPRIQRLARSDREAIVDVLRCSPGGVSPSSGGVSDVARNLLLPDAATAGQRRLETGVLVALGQTMHHLHRRSSTSVMEPAHTIRAVLPGMSPNEGLTLRLHPDACGPLLTELLPCLWGDELSGVPGLRPRIHRRHVELFLVDATSHARVALEGINEALWEAAVLFAREMRAVEKLPLSWLWQDYPDTLAPAERERMKEDRGGQRAWVPSTYLASAFLRRHLILRDALWVQPWPGGSDWRTEWQGGLSIESIVAKLLNPIFGLPGCAYDAERRAIRRHREPEPASLFFSRLDKPQAQQPVFEAAADNPRRRIWRGWKERTARLTTGAAT